MTGAGLNSADGRPGGKQMELPGPNYLKMAVSNVVAGCIIGKQGTNITQIANDTGCTVRLSSSNCYFPGTTDRVVVISGELDKIDKVVITILEHMARVNVGVNSNAHDDQTAGDSTMDSVDGEGRASETVDGSSKMTCRLIVPKSSVSAIIGLGGAQIKQLQETTGARIQISNREEGLDERVVHIQGSLEGIKDAALTVALKIQNDQNLRNHMYVDYLPQQQGTVQGPVPMAGFPQYAAAPAQYPWTPDVIHMKCEVFIQIPDGLTGTVIGRNGANLNSIAETTKAKITVSQKNEFFPRTQNRTVTIKGSVAQVHAAHILLMQKLNTVPQFQQSLGLAQVPGNGGLGYGVQGYGGHMRVGQNAPQGAQAPLTATYFQQQHPQSYHPYHVPAGQPAQPWG